MRAVAFAVRPVGDMVPTAASRMVGAGWVIAGRTASGSVLVRVAVMRSRRGTGVAGWGRIGGRNVGAGLIVGIVVAERVVCRIERRRGRVAGVERGAAHVLLIRVKGIGADAQHGRLPTGRIVRERRELDAKNTFRLGDIVDQRRALRSERFLHRALHECPLLGGQRAAIWERDRQSKRARAFHCGRTGCAMMGTAGRAEYNAKRQQYVSNQRGFHGVAFQRGFSPAPTNANPRAFARG